MSNRLMKRLRALGDNEGALEPVTLITTRVYSPSENGPIDEGLLTAQVLASEAAKGTTLRRNDDESEPGFLSRVDEAHIAIHGFPMEHWA